MALHFKNLMHSVFFKDALNISIPCIVQLSNGILYITLYIHIIY